ncbi:hypothetical protein [Lutibacter citreus]|uniref:hypothetical protein n=1 Tax=Lutibacter citreus TaxID=2138210 RepID=UPI000DBE0D53|nr:hypothetical protein [Lutibacter citreus]
MKKLVGILTLVLVFTLSSTVNAQQQQKRSHKKSNYSSEQMATLMTKKLTLHLDLDLKQQKEVLNLITKEATQRKAMMEKMKERRANGEKPTDAEKFEFENNRLDRQIAQKNDMKKILSNEQFEKWEKVQNAKMRHGKKSKHSKGKKNSNMNKGQRTKKA